MQEIANFITQTDQDTNYFELFGIKEYRKAFEYYEYDLKLHYINSKVRFTISIDFTTGEDLIDVTESNMILSLFIAVFSSRFLDIY
ncbi:hypothetical protein [Alkalibacterium sp. 20]|uniref:hypothetical protein n=1 Tax=Alkalibacterium sp. 20 TaxID=1798803 RepID=UPI0009001984|nr:hypothetical protein [Alkalibacterium sp. 20]OJF91690.1 hypothetical protein AX762_10930 [Alkalibacterium sp. 20]